MVLVILVVILEQLCVLVHCEGESLYEGVKARGAVLYLLPENLGQFVWTVETVCVTGLPFHQRISARWEQHLPPSPSLNSRYIPNLQTQLQTGVPVLL